MIRNSDGFTLIEVTVVLVLISIIAAAVLARSLSTDQANVVGEVDKIRAHIRYAHALAMKRGEIYGIKSEGGTPGSYWMFRGVNPDNVSNQIALPGEPAVKISLPGAISMHPFTVFFDKYGKPYSSYSDEFTNIPLSSELSVTISGSAQSLAIIPETGVITTR